MPETFASTFRDMPRNARMVRTRWPSCSRKPVSGSGCSVMSPFLFSRAPLALRAILSLGQANFAKAPPIKITLRLQLFGSDERLDPVRYEVHVPAPRQSESRRDVIDDACNLHELRFATRQDGFIDHDISHVVLAPVRPAT